MKRQTPYWSKGRAPVSKMDAEVIRELDRWERGKT